MDFDTCLHRYACLIVQHGLNVQKGQLVNIKGEICHRALALLIAEESYRRGARFVHCDLYDPGVNRVRHLLSPLEDLSYVPGYVTARYDELLDSTGATVSLAGQEDPLILSDLDPVKLNASRQAGYTAIKRFYEEGIGHSRVHWTVAAAATSGWGRRVFPDLDPETAREQLWWEIFKICRVDRTDYLEAWKQHDLALHSRAQQLNRMQIRQLHFEGPGTDLRVSLSKRAIFKAGTDKSPLGVAYEPNLPTEECFTTPDWRQTSGNVVATRPFYVNGKLIEGLELEFKEGEIVNFQASSGVDTFKEYIGSDPGAKRLGEVALVGIDSPVFKSGLVFEEILLDENAACHIAIGSAYKFCLEGAEELSSADLTNIGCNESSVHTDIMISSEAVDVTGVDESGVRTPLLKKGEWAL